MSNTLVDWQDKWYRMASRLAYNVGMYPRQRAGARGDGVDTTIETKTCTWLVDGAPCGEPTDNYPWGGATPDFRCDHHAKLAAVGHACMAGCGAVIKDEADAANWYVDNGGQICPACGGEPAWHG
jgi:hypothetical protein